MTSCDNAGYVFLLKNYSWALLFSILIDLFFACRGSFMRICRRSSSLISSRKLTRSSSTGPVGTTDMISLCTCQTLASLFNLHISLREVFLTIQRFRQQFRRHFQVPTRTESTERSVSLVQRQKWNQQLRLELIIWCFMIPRRLLFMKRTF